ncbi:probable tRNA (uracil-O(2)-)-methyltransferase isoform X2 [Dermochelys coriacea]|uniref:probable tRNA (uracil-O(2)-)-methyltransferase isoform X2 n=1 Tax=Dermochelys coriacea TaxID=27794 RepID=UPI001CA8498B|nr:probable tRNA (uracil-O(2)-)-methyltransferase isoform X2 [Dermochelys coriacea]
MLEALWSDFSRMIAQGDWEMPAFIKELGKENQPETDALDLDAVLRTLFPKSHLHHCSTAPRKEMVIKVKHKEAVVIATDAEYSSSLYCTSSEGSYLLRERRNASLPKTKQDTFNGTVTFLPLEENDEGKYQVKKCNIYQIRLTHAEDDEWSVSILTSSPENWVADGIVYPKTTWLGNELLPKLAKWSTEKKQSEFKSTLSLISVAKYSRVYQELKEKYKEMVKILWEEERAEKGLSKKQSFVDLGCGNGLLVHILSNEGYPGRGIDVRRRKIWDMYGPQTHLEECAVRPDDSYLFSNVDWLIGNHSDELTPWIPVIAARSSYSCCYFVLPCCFFDFHGKYNRRQSQKTQYREYLDFVTQVGLECGFTVEEDCLRIPSTKRVCLIGKSRTYPPMQEDRINKQRTQYINNRQSGSGVTSDKTVGSNQCDNHHVVNCVIDQAAMSECVANETKTDGGRVWLSGFQPREKVEQVRNCAALPRDFVDVVVLTVASLLLNATQEKPWDHTLDVRLNTWNKGESLSLREVAEHLDKATLKRLKNEYGGLQTLLRNNHQVFEVLNGRVHIRDWREEKPSRGTKSEVKRRFSAEAFKTRLCWFFIHHPDGCSLTSESCPYAHGTEELRQSQIMKKKKHPQ